MKLSILLKLIVPWLKCRRQDMCVVLEDLEPSLCFPVPVLNRVCVSASVSGCFVVSCVVSLPAKLSLIATRLC